MSDVRFDGLKVWTSITVPNTVKLDLRKKGAQLVHLERDAEIILVDPDQYVAYPEKSYSFRWVEDCIRKDQRLDEEKYLVSTIRANAPRSTESPAPVPSSYYAKQHLAKGGRRTRTPFTNEDDQILVQWIREKITTMKTSAGVISGNVIYKELEQKHPHHSYHSWRDRWIKKLQFTVDLDNVKLTEPAEPAESSPPPSAASRPAAPAPEPAPASTRHSIDRSRELQPEGDDICFLRKRDLSIFKGMYEQAVNSKHTTFSDFFKQLNNKHPSTPVEEWKARYMRLRKWYSKIDTFDQEPPAPPPAVETREQQTSAEEDYEEDDSDADFDASALLNEVTVQNAEQKQFYDDVEIYNDVNDKYIPNGVIIGGRLIDTYSLWTTVREVSPDRTDRDWAKIVAALRFDTSKNPTVERDLANWYMDNLSVLEEALVGGESLLVDEDESMLMEQHALGHTEIEAEEVTEVTEEATDEVTGETMGDPSPQRQLPSAAKRQLAEAFPDPSPSPESEGEGEAKAENMKKRRVSPPGVEPETQDFAYPPETQAAGRPTEAPAEAEVTPTQQLHTESRVVEAVPLTLPPKKATNLLSSAQRSRQSLPAFFSHRQELMSSQKSSSPPQGV